ncbi:MAG: di-heme oxidoredictase family protein [Polyangiaceae bacterium]
MNTSSRHAAWLASTSLALAALGAASCSEEAPIEESTEQGEAPLATDPALVGREVAVPVHLQDGLEFQVPLKTLLAHGQQLFTAVFTPQEGGGRPLTKGTGDPLVDPSRPLLFPHNFNRISAMDSNSCASCHNTPFVGGGGHFSANAFIPGQRFDFITFDHSDDIPTRGALDEEGKFPTLQTITNSRATLGMNGSGFIEMLARQMTFDLLAIRDAIGPGQSADLITKGISFGELARGADGSWDTSAVEGLPAPSTASDGPGDPPSLIVTPFHQAATVISIRQFTNNAFNHHHGIQTTERFGAGTDPDGDGFVDEATRADVTATAVFQASLSVPGRVIPNDAVLEDAILVGEQRFQQIGCASCHVSSLPLVDDGWVFVEPNPFNPEKNLRPGDAPDFAVDLTSNQLPSPRLKAKNGVVHVPAFTDLKLHDITTGPDDPNRDPIDMNAPGGSPAFFAGTGRFLTKKLWGAANEPPYFHHGKFTTLREAILAHAGEAQGVTDAYQALGAYEQGAIVEFLKTLQVLPPGTKDLIVDQHGKKKTWPPGN